MLERKNEYFAHSDYIPVRLEKDDEIQLTTKEHGLSFNLLGQDGGKIVIVKWIKENDSTKVIRRKMINAHSPLTYF